MKREILEAANWYLEAEDDLERRKAARHWLEIALSILRSDGFPIQPGAGIYKALEELDKGQRVPILRLPEGVAPGGKSDVDAIDKGHALAILDGFLETGLPLSEALDNISNCLRIEKDRLINLRKKVKVQRSRPPAKRTGYTRLLESYDQKVRELQAHAWEIMDAQPVKDRWPNFSGSEKEVRSMMHRELVFLEKLVGRI